MVDILSIKNAVATSPSYLLDADAIIQSVESIIELREMCGCKLLYSIKSLPLVTVLKLVKPYVDGFSVSSLFEARLANEILAGQGSIHLTTPGIRPDEISELTAICSHISCNSLNQYCLFADQPRTNTSIGLRVNPKLSFTEDERYDPCRPFSKLGISIDQLAKNTLLNEIRGLHFHTVFGSMSYSSMLQTLERLLGLFDKNLYGLEWLNLGGGYLYDQISDNNDFVNLVKDLRRIYSLEVFIEPGNAIVGKAGYLLATVIDLFDSDGKAIAVLDTSVNHHPEVFEYQRPPELFEEDENGDYQAILAGSTCLAGDTFGEYRFSGLLQVGDRVVFKNVGAYSLVKANRFNGYNLPDVYWHKSGQVNLIKQYSYEDYRRLWLNDDRLLKS